MKDLWKHVRVEQFLWAVVLVKLASDREFPWGAVPVLFFLLLKPLAEKLADQWLARRQVVEHKLETLEARLGEVQNRMASLSLAAGLKRQGP